MFKIRKAHKEDCRKIYDIRNDESVLQYSFNPHKTSFETHLGWFESSLNNDLRKIFVIESEDNVAGVVRYDLNQDMLSAEVSIYVAKNFWGKGLGKWALIESESLLKLEAPQCQKIIAKVFLENLASLKIFEKCDYKKKVVEFIKEI